MEGLVIEVHAVPPADNLHGGGYNTAAPWPTITGVTTGSLQPPSLDTIIPVDIPKYIRLRRENIGKGTFGKIFDVKDPSREDKIFAMKMMKMGDDASKMMKAQREVFIQKACRNEYVCELEEACRNKDDTVFMLLELCVMDLSKYITNHLRSQTGMQKLGEIKHILLGILNGLAFMHSQGFAHRDLKAQNIFLKSEGGIKIGDFGSARLVEAEDVKGQKRNYSLNVGTVTTCAPELLLGNRKYGVEVDMWSVACIISRMFLGYSCPKSEQAYTGDDDENNFAQLVAIANFCGNLPASITPKIYMNLRLLRNNKRQVLDTFQNKVEGDLLVLDLIDTAFELDPKKRLPAHIMLTHDFFGDNGPPAIKTLPAT